MATSISRSFWLAHLIALFVFGSASAGVAVEISAGGPIATRGTQQLLPEFARTTIDDVATSSGRLRSKQITEGARDRLEARPCVFPL